MTIKTIRLKQNMGITNQTEREVKTAIIILALFTAGMIVGAGLMRAQSLSINENFIKLFNTYIQYRNSSKSLRIFTYSIASNSIILFLSFLCGLHCFGLPVLSSIPIIRGLGYGMLSGYLMTQYRINGIGYYLLTILPSGIITTAILVLSCTISSVTSYNFAIVVLGKRQTDAKELISYIKKYALFLILTIFNASLDTLISKSFSYLFVF